MFDKEDEKISKSKHSISKIESEKVEDGNGELFPSIPREISDEDIAFLNGETDGNYPW